MPSRDPETFARYVAGYKAWAAAGKPMSEEERRRAEDHLERSSVELGGPIPARFKHLQYLNKKR